MEIEQLKLILEAAILAAGEPVSLERLRDLFDEENRPSKDDLRNVLAAVQTDYENRGVELKEVASGFCFQAKAAYAPWIKRLWTERAPRHSRALLETLALIAYRQPITRGEIEDIRGVAVSTNIIKTLMENEWIESVGFREVPGRPSLYATTKQFLDHFNLKSLEELPVLIEPQNIEALAEQLENKVETADAVEAEEIVIEINETAAVEEDELKTEAV